MDASVSPMPLWHEVCDEQYQPSKKLIQLFHALGMPEENLTLIQISDWSLLHIKRTGERWDEQSQAFEGRRSELLPLLVDLGFCQARHLQMKEYTGALILGATVAVVRERLSYIIHEWMQGVRFKYLYFLTGQRYLEPTLENRETLFTSKTPSLPIRSDWKIPVDLPSTEREMMQLVWEQSDVPEDMRCGVILYVIHAPERWDSGRNRFIRPNTESTVETWLREKPEIGKYLVVSNAPHILRQDAVFRSKIPQDYEIETVGPAIHEQEQLAIILDALSRLLAILSHTQIS